MMYKVRAIVGLFVVLASLSASGFEIYSDGGGTIAPDLYGKDLVEGRIYTITARPQPGFLFYVWHLKGTH
jgi:hypothetical protein